jgi:hypothetical protein
MHPDQTAYELARREAAWRESIEAAAREAREHFQEIGAHLELAPERTRALVNACLEAARQYHVACTYANYYHRTGHPWPDEWDEAKTDLAHAAWSSAIAQLDSTLRVRS